MQAECNVSDEHLEELSARIAKSFFITEEEALELIYEEWERVEALFAIHKKINLVHLYLIGEINELYRIA
ncbi:MAG TPA: hypothetical protein CFH81_07505 [Sulfurovum sp. UBA12169]|nr:MAG TPA: hypothetical protein CFH81_07505 [Sulfurovum sp. UBA12169]